MKCLLGLVASFGMLAALCWGSCENPASFKKCLGQTRAEVNICGVNMTCKCLRQENVVRCYEKCGDDEYYRRLALGEKGQQQIFCSQRRPGEPDDLPIIGSDGPSPSKKENKAVKPKKADAPVVPPPKQQPSVPQDLGWERRNNGVVVGSSGGGGSMVRNLDVEGSAARTAASAGAVAASIVAVVLNFY